MTLAMERLGWIILVIAAATSGKAASADDWLPAGAKPLQEIMATLEADNYRVVEASMDDGRWEVDAYQADVAYELHVDPSSGKVLSSHRDHADPAPPADALPLSKVLDAVAKAGYSEVTSAEFEHGQWEIDARKDNARRELRVDPKSGKIVSDRADD